MHREASQVTAGPWPPPPAEHDERVVRTLGLPGRDQERVTLRRVQLWGRPVEVDSAGRVWCACCWQLVDVGILGTPGNGHIVSPFAGVHGLRILPLPEHDD